MSAYIFNSKSQTYSRYLTGIVQLNTARQNLAKLSSLEDCDMINYMEDDIRILDQDSLKRTEWILASSNTYYAFIPDRCKKIPEKGMRFYMEIQTAHDQIHLRYCKEKIGSPLFNFQAQLKRRRAVTITVVLYY